MVEWTKETMESAVNAVKDGMTVRKASIVFGISKTTLQSHVNNDDIGNVGKPSVLEWQEELLLVTLIVFMSDIGFGLCKLQIIEIVKYYLIEIAKTNLFTDGLPSDKWYYGFLGRHDSIRTRLASTMQSLRATMTQPEVFDSWFKSVKEGFSSFII